MENPLGNGGDSPKILNMAKRQALFDSSSFILKTNQKVPVLLFSPDCRHE